MDGGSGHHEGMLEGAKRRGYVPDGMLNRNLRLQPRLWCTARIGGLPSPSCGVGKQGMHGVRTRCLKDLQTDDWAQRSRQVTD
jgi:hypothetical protein